MILSHIGFERLPSALHIALQNSLVAKTIETIKGRTISLEIEADTVGVSLAVVLNKVGGTC